MGKQLNEKQVMFMIYQIGVDLINDLSEEKNMSITLEQYGQKILDKHPKLVQLKNYKK